MPKIANVTNVTKFSWSTVGGVVVGLAVFGGLIYAINKAPANAVTKPLKAGASVVS